MRSVQARVFGGVVAWIGGTVTATVLSLLAVSALGHGMAFGGTQTLSSDQVARALQEASASARATPTPSSAGAPTPPAGGASPSGAPAAPQRPGSGTPSTSAPGQAAGPGAAFTSAGGTVFARCGAGGAYLTSWSPAQGYQAQQVLRGPAEEVAVRFVSGGSTVVLHVDCLGGQPHSWVSQAWGDDGVAPGDH